MPSPRNNHTRNSHGDTAAEIRCGIYIRKSREEKDKPSHRLTVQREQLPAIASDRGWQASVYDDGHASAARGKAELLHERSRLESDIRAGKINVLLCIELSRLSRDDTLQDYTAWLALCSEHKVKLATPSRILDPAQHSDWMLLIMEGGFSSVEMKVLQGRMKEGREQAWREGKWLGGQPPPPYKYDHAAGRPVIDPEQLPRMQQLWLMAETLSAKAISEQMSMPEIAVRRAISDDRLLIYQAKRIDLDGFETIPCDWEPCMDADQALRIRAGRRSRKNLHGAKAPYAALLSALGVLYCGYCGATVKTWQGRGDKPADQRNYYGCQKKSGKTCPDSRMIKQITLNRLVTENILNTLSMTDELQCYWEQNEQAQDAGKTITKLTRQQREAEQKRQRLVQAIGEGVIEFADAKQQMNTIKAEIDTLGSQIQALHFRPQAPDWGALSITHAEWSGIDTDDQRAIIAATVERIDFYQTYAIITYRFPRHRSGRCASRIHLPTPSK